MRTAAALDVPRLAATLHNELARLNLRPADSADVVATPGPNLSGETETMLADNEIHRLIASGSPVDACARADALARRLIVQRRPRALLRVQLSRVSALRAARRHDEARAELVGVVRQCEDLGLPGMLLCAGPLVGDTLADLGTDGDDFVERVVALAVNNR